MSRLLHANIIAMSGRAVRAAGRVEVQLFDKGCVLTLGNRQAVRFIPAPGITEAQLAEAAHLAALADDTPEGRSIVRLARERGLRTPDLTAVTFIPFATDTRMSDARIGPRDLRKGPLDAIQAHLEGVGQVFPRSSTVLEVSRRGGSPLLVSDGPRVLGFTGPGELHTRLGRLRRWGLKTVLITTDKPRVAAALAAKAGMDDFQTAATPDATDRLIRSHQGKGRSVAIACDPDHDAAALAKADVALVLKGSPAAVGLVDLDARPTKLFDLLETTRRMRMTRDALTCLQHRQRSGEEPRPGARDPGHPPSAAQHPEPHAPGEPGLRFRVCRDRKCPGMPHSGCAQGCARPSAECRGAVAAPCGDLRRGGPRRRTCGHQAGWV
jgi:K+-transporting ATPase ATPase B chain